MSRHLSLVHATSAGCCAVGLALYWAHSITLADSVARVPEATRERKQVDSTNSIVLPETVITLVSGIWRERRDLNLRPLAPMAGVLTSLNHAPAYPNRQRTAEKRFGLVTTSRQGA